MGQKQTRAVLETVARELNLIDLAGVDYGFAEGNYDEVGGSWFKRMFGRKDMEQQAKLGTE